MNIAVSDKLIDEGRLHDAIVEYSLDPTDSSRTKMEDEKTACVEKYGKYQTMRWIMRTYSSIGGAVAVTV